MSLNGANVSSNRTTANAMKGDVRFQAPSSNTLNNGSTGSTIPTNTLNNGSKGSTIPTNTLNNGSSGSTIPTNTLNNGSSGSTIPTNTLNNGSKGSTISTPSTSISYSCSSTSSNVSSKNSTTPSYINNNIVTNNTVGVTKNYYSILDIYHNYEMAANLSDELESAGNAINSDINKIKELLDDLNTNWKGTKSKSTIESINSYLESLLEVSKFYIKMSELLNQSTSAYKNVDSHFESELV